ncbi:ATP-binding protein [Planomonospora corallina]|uniref:histidine kinase n=1 Tax=Planomonospora corallina TaxID=1806052 RepID=A0ABV8IFC7_9ACTN
MSLTVEVIDRNAAAATTVIRISGGIDARTSALLDAGLHPLTGAGVRHLLIDACAVGFCDTGGVHMLHRTHARLWASGGEVIIVASVWLARVLAVHWRPGPADRPWSCQAAMRFGQARTATPRSCVSWTVSPRPRHQRHRPDALEEARQGAMTSPPWPSDEAGRLQELHGLHALDAVLEADYRAIAGVAAYVCRTPISVVNLMDADYQHFKGRCGLDLTGIGRRQMSFCSYAIRGCGVLEVHDALADARFRRGPAVQGEPYLRFYAGVPVVTSGGHALGAVFVADHRPRRLLPEQRRILPTLAAGVAHLAELHHHARHAQLVERVRAGQLAMTVHAPAPVMTCADAGRARYAIEQLLDNAVKFTPPGGRIEVVVHADPVPAVEVRDTGIGIKEGEIERVGDDFFRGAGAEEHAISGTGLGLSLASKIARMHGGDVRIDSRPGRGTRVRLILPGTASCP